MTKRKMLAAAVLMPLIAGEVLSQEEADRGTGATATDEIVVTGSKLRRTNLISPIPVIDVNAEDFDLSGATQIGDLLNELPAIGLGSNSTTNFGSTATDEAGTNLLNLRSLGTERTLVVVDGRRHIGSVAGTTAVDIGSIPVALVDRVEISTGGASVSYGADAIAGVVNILLKDDFEGISFDARAGGSDKGDAEQNYFSLTAGSNFAFGRGNATVNFTYSDTKGVGGIDREFNANQPAYIPNPDDTGPNDGIPDRILIRGARLPLANFNGVLFGFFTGGLSVPELQFTPDGGVTSFDPGIGSANPFNQGGDGLNLAELNTIANPVERILIDSRMRYDLTSNTSLFLEGKFYNVDVVNSGQTNFTFFNQLSPDNPFLPFGDPDFDQLFADNAGFVFFSRSHDDIGRWATSVNRNTYRLLGGIEGEIPGMGWDYDLYAQYGESREDRILGNVANERRMALAIDVTADALGLLGAPGAPVCRSTLEAAATGNALALADPDVANCLPLNVFGVNLFDPAAADYVLLNQQRQQVQSQAVVGGHVSGSFADLPAGPVSFVAGFEHRKETSESNPDATYSSGQTLFVEQATRGSFDVDEIFAEFAVPLLSEVPGAYELSVEGGARFSDYSTVGDTTAHRFAVLWSPVESLQLRAGYSEAIRAPNITELFMPVQTSAIGILDPCDMDNLSAGPDPSRRLSNCTAQLAPLGLDPQMFADPAAGISVPGRGITGGNPGLDEEATESITAGIVFTPGFLEDFSLSIDYFSVDITGAINFPDQNQIAADCVDRFDTIDNEFCALFEREDDPSNPFFGSIKNLQVTQLNIDALEVEGIDFQVNYALNIGGAHDLAFRLVGTYLDKLDTLPASDAQLTVEDAGNLGTPEWRANFNASYLAGPFMASWTARFIGESSFDVQEGPEVRSPNSTGAELIHDLQARYRLDIGGDGSSVEVYLGVNNVFDDEPPAMSRLGNGASNSALYDPIGRYVYGGLRARFD